MTRARMRLEAAGFRVVNIQYRSMKKPIGDLGAKSLQKVINAVQQLRGEYPDEITVDGARTAITSNGGSGALFCDVMILATEAAA